jgi:Rho termination factor, N-terminal domain
MAAKEKQDKEKPLEEMTSKELREMALGISEISGAHGMNKSELISAIKKAKGISEETSRRAASNVREIKVKIRALKEKRVAALAAKDANLATRYRRTISRLKKKTRL